ncbi:MAG: BclA C-terminal domain [Clostridia bacterium]|nr:BclA C-terminal domain [Clostridia bacterium]
MSNFKNPCFDECEFEPDCCEIKPKCHDFEPRCPRITVLQAVSLVPQTVAAGLAVPFDTNLVAIGNGIIHTPGGTDFNLIKPGIYRVTFTGSVTPVGTTAGVALAVNGAIVPGTTVTETVIAATPAALATQAIIQVSPFISTVLTVVNPTAGTETFTNPNVIIEKIG